MGKVHWRKRKWQRAMQEWIVRPMCNVQDISKQLYEATTMRKYVTCRACIRIGDKDAKHSD